MTKFGASKPKIPANTPLRPVAKKFSVSAISRSSSFISQNLNHPLAPRFPRRQRPKSQGDWLEPIRAVAAEIKDPRSKLRDIFKPTTTHTRACSFTICRSCQGNRCPDQSNLLGYFGLFCWIVFVTESTASWLPRPNQAEVSFGGLDPKRLSSGHQRNAQSRVLIDAATPFLGMPSRTPFGSIPAFQSST